MLAQAAKASIPPLLHAIAKQIQHFGRQQAPQQQPVAANAAIWSQVCTAYDWLQYTKHFVCQLGLLHSCSLLQYHQ